MKTPTILCVGAIVWLFACSSSPPSNTGSTGATGGGNGSSSGDSSGSGGASSNDSITVEGSVQGVTVVGKGAAFSEIEGACGAGPVCVQALIEIENQEDLCALDHGRGDVEKPNLSELLFVIDAQGSTLAPGKYTIGASDVLPVQVLINSFDATCHQSQYMATSGTITITSAGSTLGGSFDLAFNTEHVSGSFEGAPKCEAGSGGSAPKGCTP